MKPKENTKTLRLWVTPEVEREIRDLALFQGTTVSGWLREAVKLHLQKSKQKGTNHGVESQ